MAHNSVEEPVASPVDLFSGGESCMDTADGYQIPRIRHVSGPCWYAELGPIKEILEKLHTKSQPHGWTLRYWSHQAMDATMAACPIDELRNAYFDILAEHRGSRADLFRLYILFSHG